MSSFYESWVFEYDHIHIRISISCSQSNRVRWLESWEITSQCVGIKTQVLWSKYVTRTQQWGHHVKHRIGKPKTNSKEEKEPNKPLSMTKRLMLSMFLLRFMVIVVPLNGLKLMLLLLYNIKSSNLLFRSLSNRSIPSIYIYQIEDVFSHPRLQRFSRPELQEIG